MIKYALRSTIRGLLHRFGIEVSRYVPLARALNANKIDLVFDIGANKGQFASQLRRDGFQGKIVSFEPTAEAHAVLVRESKGDAMWHVHERCAIGADDRIVDINVSKNSGSSSILPILVAHTDAAPDSVYVNKESVKQVRFDSVFPDYVKGSNHFFLKIDTQGYEERVMQGATEALLLATGLQVEVSFEELYENQPAYKYFLSWAEANGFGIWSIHDGFSNMLVGKTLQADICFFRLRL